MRRCIFLLLLALAVFVAARPVAGQKFLPKSIQFQGAPEYSNEELLSAAGLKKGVVLNFDDMKAFTQRLMDSGVFTTAAFKFDGQDLTFTLSPSLDLYPIKLENLPLTPGKELDAKLHEKLPLFHGMVPVQGGLTDGVRSALEQLLAAEGLKASVIGTANGQPTDKGGLVGFSITSPPVVVGEIRIAGNSSPLDQGAQDILGKITGSPYDVAGSPGQISIYLGNYYRDKGYVEASIEAAQQSPATATADAIHVPFEISATPGIQYRLAAVQLAPDLAISQTDFDKKSPIHPGEIAEGQRLTKTWELISKQYHNHGFMKASVHPIPSFDRTKGTVTFAVTADPGPVYSMGTLAIENVSDDLRTVMLSEWKMPPGSIFNEGAVLNFFAIGDANPQLKRVFASVNCKYVLKPNDDSRTVDVVLRLEKKN